MKTNRVYIFIFALFFTHSFLLAETVSINNNGLEFSAELAEVHPIVIIDKDGPESTDRIFSVTIYVKNAENEFKKIPLGLDKNIKFDRNPSIISLQISMPKDNRGNILKISDVDLRMVDLNKGERARLCDYQINISHSVKEIKFLYSVDEIVAKYYNTWYGVVSFSIPIPKRSPNTRGR